MRENEGMELSPLARFFIFLSLFGASLWWVANGPRFVPVPVYIFSAFIACGGFFCASIGSLFGRTTIGCVTGGCLGLVLAIVAFLSLLVLIILHA